MRVIQSRFIIFLAPVAAACGDPSAPPDDSVVAAIRISPESVTVAMGDSVDLVATALTHDGDIVPVTVTWSISDTLFATVTPAGRLYPVRPGQPRVRAAAGAAVGEAAVMVRPGPPVTLSLEPDTLWVAEGDTASIRALALDAWGNPIAAPGIEWSSSDESTARVNGAGLVTALRPGVLTVTGRAGVASAPITVQAALAFTALGGGSGFACGVRSGDVYCWGSNLLGRVWDDPQSSTCGLHPCSLYPVRITASGTFVAVDGGDRFACGLTAAGQVYCFGENDSGQLGDGTGTGSTTPVPVSLDSTATQIAVGYSHACALTPSGAALCWGTNVMAELGVDSAPDDCGFLGPLPCSRRPIPVSGPWRYTALAAGNTFTCGLLADRSLRCWGNNGGGQLGFDTLPVWSATPLAVAGMDDVIAVSAGYAHACAVRAGGAAYCWGANWSGQLGNNAPLYVPPGSVKPVAVVGGHQFSRLVASGSHTCGLATDGTWCWGSNGLGDLGTGDTSVADRRIPVRVTGGIRFRTLVEAQGTCALGPALLTYCWGGWILGNGIEGGSRVPVPTGAWRP
jgi:alpha-tubulin suppressor-like RCC1 family protein